MNVKLAESDEDLERVSGVLLELRSAFNRESLIEQVHARRHGKV